MGKGSKPRPIKDIVQFRKNWDSIFKSKKRKNNTCELLFY